MGSWFEEQIKQRKESDAELFEDSLFNLAQVVLGKKIAAMEKSQRLIAKHAIDEILKFYHYKPLELPKNIETIDDQLEYLFRPKGIMRRKIRLSKGWSKDAYGPVLAFYKDSDEAVALLPNDLKGYYFFDRKTGKKKRVTASVEDLFEDEAICFYRPLPPKKLKIQDLVTYMKDTVTLEDFLLVFVAVIVAAILGLIAPMVIKAVTGPIAIQKNRSMLLGAGIFLICTTLSVKIFEALEQLVMARIQIKTALSVESAVMMRVISLPAKFFRKYNVGELVSRCEAVSTLCERLVGSVTMSVFSAVVSLIYLNQIAYISKALFLPSLLIILATLVLTLITACVEIGLSRKELKIEAKKRGLSYAFISGIQKIKLSGAEKRAFAKWAEVYAEEAEHTFDPPLIIKVHPVIALAISLIGNLMIFDIAIAANLEQSSYFAFNTSYGLVSGAFFSLAGVAISFAKIRPILEMAEPILLAEPEISEANQVISKLSGNIEVNNVSFKYGDDLPNVVENLSFKIKSGEYVAIVGKTGCGKSTILRLLLGFEKPQKGAIYYDGKDISKIDLKSLRMHIGTVMQDDNLFQGDIFSNIAIASQSLTLDQAWEAAELAGIADDIRKMPMGMSTLITEGQGGISGGQKQRLTIARAVASKPKILMFDEATSALDNKTQKQISQALDGLNCTRIVIAHRLSTIKNCDRILVIDKGRIVEDGTYEDLIAADGFFAELVARQQMPGVAVLH